MSQNPSSCARLLLSNCTLYDETSRSEPSRSLRFNLSRSGRLPYAVQSGVRFPAIAYLPGLYCRPLRTNLLEPTLKVMLPGVQGSAAPHGPIPCGQASRFRTIFQVLFCRGPMLRPHAPLTGNFLVTRARGTPLRSARGGDGARPAAANKAATGSACPAPSSTTSTPPGASSAGAAAAMAR